MMVDRARQLGQLQKRLGYIWLDQTHIDRALTHSSYGNANGVPHGERDEFLGDSVLDLVTAEWLMAKHPDKREGFMSQRRAEMVCANRLVAHTRALGIDRALLVGSRDQYLLTVDSVLADAFEATVGALYRDCGSLQTVRERLVAWRFM